MNGTKLGLRLRSLSLTRPSPLEKLLAEYLGEYLLRRESVPVSQADYGSDLLMFLPVLVLDAWSGLESNTDPLAEQFNPKIAKAAGMPLLCDITAVNGPDSIKTGTLVHTLYLLVEAATENPQVAYHVAAFLNGERNTALSWFHKFTRMSFREGLYEVIQSKSPAPDRKRG